MQGSEYSLFWVYSGSLANKLDSATWLETAAGLHRLGWDVTLAAREVPTGELAAGVKSLSLPRPNIYLCGYLVAQAYLLAWLVAKGSRFDVVLFNEDEAPCLQPLLLLRRLLRRQTPRLVMDSRSMPMSAATTRERVRATYFHATHKIASQWVDGQTAITWRLAEALAIPQERLLGVWPSGVNLEQFRVAADLRRWPGPEGPLRLIYVGALHPTRNLTGLIEAVRIARDGGVDVQLELAGDGPQRAALERQAREVADGAIRVRQAVPHAAVPRLLGGADIGVLPFPDSPEFRVSSPIKLFEYMAAAMAILATRVVCHTDVCGSDDYVFWADDSSPAALAEAMCTANARRAQLRQMGQCALAAASAWTWSEAARKLDAGLRREIDRAQHGSAPTRLVPSQGVRSGCQ